jgi:hypothetical protein
MKQKKRIAALVKVRSPLEVLPLSTNAAFWQSLLEGEVSPDDRSICR